MKKNLLNTLLFSLISLCSSAQTDGYRFYSPLDTVKSDGFYSIDLTPLINAHLKTDYSDVRIVNDSGKWVPHILRNPSEGITNHSARFNLKFKKNDIPGVSTTLIVENTSKEINNIELTITNTQAERFCSLSGSNDEKEWFIINDSILVNPVSAAKELENIFTINFPSSGYRFFKIVINNKNKDPFNIVNVSQQTGVYNSPYNRFTKVENTATYISQKDSGKISYIKITQQQPFHFDYINLKLGGVKYYSREVDFYVPYNDANSFSNPGQLLRSFTVSNNSTLQFHVPRTKAKVFYLFIKNEDNLPLKVTEINTACSNHYITAYLEKAHSYKLILDNELAIIPNYDLYKLDNKITDSTYVLQSGAIMPFAETKSTAVKTRNNNWMLWSAIVAALLTLLFFTYRMIKEVDKRKTT